MSALLPAPRFVSASNSRKGAMDGWMPANRRGPKHFASKYNPCTKARKLEILSTKQVVSPSSLLCECVMCLLEDNPFPSPNRVSLTPLIGFSFVSPVGVCERRVGHQHWRRRQLRRACAHLWNAKSGHCQSQDGPQALGHR